MRRLIRWAIDNSPAVNTVMLGVMFLGAVSFYFMRREVFPQFDLEIIVISVPYPGGSPEEVEEGICLKIEEAVRSIDGVKKQTAIAQEGAGFLILEMETNNNVQRSLEEVRSEIDRISTFPELAEDPTVEQITLREPAIRVGVLGPERYDTQSELQLREVAEKVRDQLLRLPAVSQANIQGERNYQIDVEISEETLRCYRLSLQQVAKIIRGQNLELPGGTVKTDSQEVLVRGKNKRLLGDEIAKIPLVSQPDGMVLTVDDLGNVRDAFEDVTSISRIDGRPGLVISIDRTKSEDLLKMVDAVKEFRATAVVPPGYELITMADRSTDVRDRMHLLLKNGLQGLALVLVMLAVFLELRIAMWVALGIPIAVLGAGAVLMGFGQTLNMLSMFAFLMALGIVVDDAIVISENIFTHAQRGMSPVEAAVHGTMEVLPSVIASVTTTIIAFTPLLFVSGVMGKFIAVMPVAVIAMLVISLLESTFILPCHLAHSARTTIFHRWTRQFLALPITRQWLIGGVGMGLATLLVWLGYPPNQPVHFLAMAGGILCMTPAAIYPLHEFLRLVHWIREHADTVLGYVVDRYYLPTLEWVLHHKLLFICGTCAFLFCTLGLVSSGFTPFIIFPKADSNELEGKIVFPNGTPESVTDQATRRMLAAFDRVNQPFLERGHSLIKNHRRLVGQVTAAGPLGPDSKTTGAHVGQVDIELVTTAERDITSVEIVSRWRDEAMKAGGFPGAESVTFGSPELGPGGSAIEFKMLAKSDNISALEAAVEECKAQLATYAGVVDIRDDSSPGKWEFQLKVKPKSVAMGISEDQLYQTVRSAYYGAEVMRLQRGRHEVKLMVRYPPEDRRRLADFREIRVRNDEGNEFPITELADVNVTRGYSEINRVNQLRSITITADVHESEGNSRDIVNKLRAEKMPQILASYPGVSVRWEGQKEQTDESVVSMFKGFMIAVLAMYVLLTVEFRSYMQPLIILSILPFGLVGAILGHAVMGLPLTIFTLFGLVALTGVVVNDSIVLIDFIDRRIRDGLELHDALMDAGRRRFRPVLLTSVTTIAGLTPMLTETSFQAQFLIPLAATLVFGLMVSTALVLLLIPTNFAVYYRVLTVSGHLVIEHDGAPPSVETHPEVSLLSTDDNIRPAQRA